MADQLEHVSIPQLESGGRKQGRWMLLVQQALAVRGREAIAVNIGEIDHHSAQQSISRYAKRIGITGYTHCVRRNGKTLIWVDAEKEA